MRAHFVTKIQSRHPDIAWGLIVIFVCLDCVDHIVIAAIAQLGERRTEDLEGPGSIPDLGNYLFELE